MGTFALPIPGYRLGQHNHRKRKRSSASLAPDEEAPEQFPSEPPSSPPVQPPPYSQDAVINPRSHDPDTLRQFAVAGLPAEAEVPSKLHPSFPHKALPPGGGAGGWRGRQRRRPAASAQVSARRQRGAPGLVGRVCFAGGRARARILGGLEVGLVNSRRAGGGAGLLDQPADGARLLLRQVAEAQAEAHVRLEVDDLALEPDPAPGRRVSLGRHDAPSSSSPSSTAPTARARLPAGPRQGPGAWSNSAKPLAG